MQLRKHIYFFELAAGFANKQHGYRSFLIGAVGVRARDGVLVVSRNSAATHKTPNIHAEARLCAKLTPGSCVYVARVLRKGGFSCAKPCRLCQIRLQAAGVSRVYYTISDTECGLLVLD